MSENQNKRTIPTDPAERKKYYAELGRRGGQKSAQSPNAARPFRDVPGLAKKAGSAKGYTFERKKKDGTDEQ